MFGRMDVSLGGTCPHCDGTGHDPKKRKRTCPKCYGSKKKAICKTCGEDMPCSGTNPNILDQAVCMKGEF